MVLDICFISTFFVGLFSLVTGSLSFLSDSILNFYSLNDKDYRFGTASKDGTVRLWTLDDYSVYSRVNISHSVTPYCVTFTDDMLISGWSDGMIRCYQVDSTECN